MKIILGILIVVCVITLGMIIALGIGILFKLLHTPEFNESVIDLHNKHPQEAAFKYGHLDEFTSRVALNIQYSKKFQKMAEIEAREKAVIDELIRSGEMDQSTIDNILANGGWICSGCRKLNRGYTENCSCGMSREENDDKVV